MSKHHIEEQEQLPAIPGVDDTNDYIQKVANANTVKFSDLAALSLKYWYWIALSLAVFLALGWLSIKKSVPMYTMSTSVLMRDDAEGSGTGSSTLSLKDLGLNTTSTVIEDEMEAMRSPDLMAQVVVDMGLQTQYYKKGRFHNTLLYGSNIPIKVSFPDIDPEERASMKVTVHENEDITVEDLTIEEDKFEVNPNQTLKFGGAINSPAGKIIFQKTPFFQKGEEYEIIVTHTPLEVSALAFCSEIEIEMMDEKHSNVVYLSCTDQNRERAEDLLTTLLKCYTNNWLESRAEVVRQTTEFITQRLADVEQELSGVDNSISSFKSSNMVPDVVETARLYMEQSAEMNSQILGYNNQLQMAKYLKNYISNEGKYQVLPVNSGLQNTHIESLANEYNLLVMQRNSYLSSTSESNPLVQDVDSRLAALRRSILTSIDNQIVALSTTIANMERKEKSNTAKVSATPVQAKFLLSAERKQKVQEALYVFLLQKREENELSQTLVSVNTRVLKKPSGSKLPTSPNKGRIYIIAFVLGLAVPVGGIYLHESNNSKVRGRKDLDMLSVPIVAEIPEWGRSLRKKSAKGKMGGIKTDPKASDRQLSKDIVVQDGNRDLINEAIRVTRSNLTRMTAADKSTVIMVTSFNPGSGKTFLSMNLGVSLALKGHKILIVDGDLRRASLSAYAGSPRHGLADYLSGAVNDIDEVIERNVAAEGLDLLPVGLIPPNPTELLESERFADLMKRLREEYRYIFIDCPPGEMMADAQIISDFADRTLFVIRVGVFERSMLKELERIYQQKKYPNVMLALNGAVVGDKYGYSYSYGYGYGTKG